MRRSLWILVAVCYCVSVARAQISAEEAYKRLRERQEQRRQATTAPTTRPDPSTSDSEPGKTPSPSSRGKWKHFHDAALGFSIDLPADWQQKDVPTPTPALTLMSHPGTSAFKVLSIVGFHTESDLKKAMKNMLAGFGESNKATLIEQTDIEVDGRPAMKATTDETLGNVHCRSVHAITIAGNMTYGLTITTPAQQFDKSALEFQGILDSFKVDAVADAEEKSKDVGARKESGETAPTELVVFEDPKLGFSIKHPTGWKREPPKSPTVVLGFTRPRSEGSDPFAESFSVTVQPCPANIPLEVLDAEAIRDLPKHIEGFKLISDEISTLSGHPARKLTYTGHMPGGTFDAQNTQVFTTIGDKLYMVNCTTLPKRSANFDDVFRAIIQSFHASEPGK